MEIFKLVGNILVDSSEAQNSISKTTDKAESLGSKLSSGIKTATKWAAGVAAAASAVGGAMVAAAKDTASELDTIDKASQRMKMTAESYQELSYQAELCGVEMSTMEKAAKKLEGTDLNMEDALAQIYELGTAEERSAKATELFGDAIAYQMTPMLNASAEDMAAMADEANSLGLVMSQESVTAGASMNDMFTKLDETFSQVKNTIVVDLMPYVMEILEWLVENLPIIAETVQNVMEKIMPIVEPVINAVLELFKAVFALINGDFDTFKESLKKLWNNLVEAFTKLETELLNIGKNLMTSLWDGIKEVWDSVKSWVSEKVSWLTDKLAFWRSGNSEMQTDGSHAAGLPYVPYDGYVAELHKGESVLNAATTSQLMQKLDSLTQSQSSGSGPIELTLNIDGKAFAKATYTAYQDEYKRQGSSLVTV